MKDAFVEQLENIAKRELTHLHDNLQYVSDSLDDILHEMLDSNTSVHAEKLKDSIDELMKELDKDFMLSEEDQIKMDKIEDLGRTLNLINYQIAELKEIKEKLERNVIELLGRAKFITDDEGKIIMTDIVHIGVKQHVVGKFKFKIKTDYNVSVNKEEYEVIKSNLNNEFNPVVEKTSYSVNNKVLKELERYGSSVDKELVGKFIVETPAKAYVSIEANA